jgi:hypothetical protein
MLGRSERLWRLVAVIAGLHLFAVSIALGPRCIAYIVAAYLSAVAVWDVVSLARKERRRVGWVAGLLVIVVIQQMAYHRMKSALPGVWWPLVQFFAVQLLIGIGVARMIGCTCRMATPHDGGAEARASRVG